jgi:hypothetical protein
MRFSPARLRWQYINRDRGIAGGLALTVFGATLTVGGWFLLALELRYLTAGVVVEARVLGKWQAALRRPAAGAAVLAHGGRNGPRYVVTYEFQDEGGWFHRGSAQIGKADWDPVRPGDVLDVEYLPDDPDTSRPLSGRRVALGVGFGLELVGCLFLFGGLTLLRRRLAAVNGLVRLVATGQPVLGLIDDVRPYGGKGDTCVTLYYRYLAEDNSVTPQVRSGTAEGVAANAGPWRVGGPVLVLVDPDDPGRHTLDLFRARPHDLERLCRVGTAGGRGEGG